MKSLKTLTSATAFAATLCAVPLSGLAATPEKLALIKGVACAAWADGKVVAQESDFIEALIAADASGEEAKGIREFAATSKTLDDVPNADIAADDFRFLINQAVLMMFVDTSQDASEAKFVRDLVAKLGFTGDVAQQIIDEATERAKRFLNLR